MSIKPTTYPQLHQTRTRTTVKVGSSGTQSYDSRFPVILMLGAGLVLASMLKGSTR